MGSPTKSNRGATAAPSQADDIRPEWLRIPAAVRFSGLSRSHLFELVRTGAVRSSCIRRRGALRGVRLIDVDSLRAFIEKHVSGGGDVDEGDA